jgi:hypothetical protein
MPIGFASSVECFLRGRPCCLLGCWFLGFRQLGSRFLP